MPNTTTMHESGAMLPAPVPQQNPEKKFGEDPISLHNQVKAALEKDYKIDNPFNPVQAELQQTTAEKESFERRLIAEQAQNEALRDANKRLAKEIEDCKARALSQTEDMQHQADKISELNAHLTASRKALGEQTQRLHELQALFMRMSAQVLMALEAAQEREYEQSLQKEL